jgi:hypothetical protein
MPQSTITASFHVLLDQAGGTADKYLADAKRCIDVRFGDGYAAKHPELVAAFIGAASADFNTSVVMKVFEPLAMEFVEAVDRLAAAVEVHADSVRPRKPSAGRGG